MGIQAIDSGQQGGVPERRPPSLGDGLRPFGWPGASNGTVNGLGLRPEHCEAHGGLLVPRDDGPRPDAGGDGDGDEEMAGA